MKKTLIMLVSMTFLSGIFTSSYAQDSPFIIEEMPNVLGVAVGILPDYVGSNDYTYGVAPFARVTLGHTDRYFLLNVTELYFNILDHPILRFGPVVNYRFGRDDDVADPVVKKMANIKGAFEAGAFMGFDWKFNHDPRQRLIGDAQFLCDVNGVYNGINGTVSARYWHPFGQMFDGVIGVGVQIVNDRYANKYFGVSNSDAMATGLPPFTAKGGVNNFRIFPGVVMHLSRQWHLTTGVRYMRLTGDAENSPVVSMRGSAHQWVFGLGTAYRW